VSTQNPRIDPLFKAAQITPAPQGQAALGLKPVQFSQTHETGKV